MGATHADDVLRQRDHYRDSLAALRLEQVSQHGLVTSLRNINDQLESENLDLRSKIANLEKKIANANNQQQHPALHSGPAKLVEDPDYNKDTVPSNGSKESTDRTLVSKSLIREGSIPASKQELKNVHQPLISAANRRRSESKPELPQQLASHPGALKQGQDADKPRDDQSTDVNVNLLSAKAVVRDSSSINTSDRPAPPEDVGGEGGKQEDEKIADSNSSLRASNDGDSDLGSSRPSASGILPTPKRESKVQAKEAFILPHERIAHHLDGCPDLNISPFPPPTSSTRACLLKYCGTNTQAFIGTVNFKNTPRPAVFAQPVQNPFLPQHPGARGLLFASRHEVLGSIHMLFVRLEPQSKQTPEWEYRGHYESVLSAKMTPAEFKMQRQDVKVNWAHHLLGNMKWECYTHMRARIYLRKTGQFPTDKKAQKEAVDEEIGRIRQRHGGALSVDDVIAALTRGDEGIDIITMKCVEYDQEFAEYLRNKSKVGVNQEEKGKSKAVSQAKTPTKRKRGSAGAQDSDLEGEERAKIGDAHGESSSAVRRSTRRRC